MVTLHKEKKKTLMDALIKRIITSQLLIYIFRCVLGFVIGYELMMNYPKYDLFWVLLSIILVISPEGKDSKRLTIERVKSNLIGSAVGLGCEFFNDKSTIYVIIVGIIITSIICYILNVMNMARVAIVALLIVLLQPHLSEIELTPIFRAGTVVLGCFIGFSITLFTSIIIQKLKKHYNITES